MREVSDRKLTRFFSSRAGAWRLHVRTKLLYLVMSTHCWLGVTRKCRSMLLLGSLNLPDGIKGETCSGILGDGRDWSSEPCRLRFFCFFSLSLELGCWTLKGHSAWLSSVSGLGRFLAVAIVKVGRRALSSVVSDGGG